MVSRCSVAQVTQRPGCSCFATSVSTLTTGSQATVRPIGCLVAPERAACCGLPCGATGTRTRIEVSERPSTETEIVRVFNTLAGASARSALASRLMAGVSRAGYCGRLPRQPDRSLPEAYCAAPRLNETARAPKIPEKIFDMACPPLFCVAARANRFTTRAAMAGSERRYHITVYKNIFDASGTSFGAARSHRSRLSPCPN